MSKSRKSNDCDDMPELASSPPEPQDLDGPIWVNRFNEDSARAFVKQLQHQSNRDPNAPILVYIDSYGGEVYGLLTMIAALEAVPNKIVTVAFGKAMSAGALLLACGDARYASQHSTLMVHELSAGAGGHIADMNIQHENLAQLNEKLLKLLARRCKTKGGTVALKKVFEKTRDLYLTPEEAIKFGLIDKIGVPSLHRKFSVEWGLMTNEGEELTDEKPAAKSKV